MKHILALITESVKQHHLAALLAVVSLGVVVVLLWVPEAQKTSPRKPAAATETSRFFRLAAGHPASTSFTVGGMVAGALSHPPGTRSCERGGGCGVPGLIAVVEAGRGGIENAVRVAQGRLEGAVLHANVAAFANREKGPFENLETRDRLRALGRLYSESLHFVVPSHQNAKNIREMKGATMAVGPPGSGTLFQVRAVLAAAGMSTEDFMSQHMPPDEAIMAFETGEIDGFFLSGVPPMLLLETLEAFRLLPLPAPKEVGSRSVNLEKRHYPFLNSECQTAGVPVIFAVSADMPAALATRITRALWHRRSRARYRHGHPRLDPEKAALNTGIPLHPGAEAYYREIGLLR